jgi:hypothetical protein
MSLAASTWSSKRNEGPQLPVDCIWTFGYRSLDVLNLLATIPSSIGGLLRTVNSLSQDPWPNTAKSPDCFSPEVAEALRMQRQMWYSQNEYGFLELSYDPATGDRSAVALNALQARIFGMSREEFKARFAAHSLPLFIPPQDLLLLLTDRARRALDHCCDSTRYHRCFTSESPPRMPIIVRITTRRSYDSLGKLTSVRE